MKVFIWNEVEQCTENYHHEGGVVVFADSEEEAREIAANNSPYTRIAANEKPDHVRECADGEKLVFVFPDAGCC